MLCSSAVVSAPGHYSAPCSTPGSDASASKLLQAPPSMLRLCWRHRYRIGLTYVLFNLERALYLVEPWLLGWAITSLTQSSIEGVAALGAMYAMQMIVGTARRMYDTRTFTRIYNELASGLIVHQREHDVDVSSVAARSALSRELIDFLERDLQVVLLTLYTVIGALVMIGSYDPALTYWCVGLGVVSLGLNLRHGRQSLALNRELNNQLETEVQIVSQGNAAAVGDHFERLAVWRVRLSDALAMTFAVQQLFALGVFVAALLRIAAVPGQSVGTVVALLRYVTMFTMGLGNLPMLAQQFSRLRDISRRLPILCPNDNPHRQRQRGPATESAGGRLVPVLGD